MQAQYAVAGATPRGLFLDAPSGRVFAVHHGPAVDSPVRGHVLFVPPFNEEMNRSRSMMTLQAKALAQMGYGSLVVDLHGTGDSAGEFSDARWALWQSDILAAHQWLAQQPGGCFALLGIRLGAILAAQVFDRLIPAATALVLWQPVLEGKVHLTQFLRVRMAAQLDRPHLPKETTASMRDQLSKGTSLEVAGYEIHPELARDIDALHMVDHAPASQARVLWMESAGGDGTNLTPSSKKVATAWVDRGVAVDTAVFSGPAFWQVHERVITTSVIALTCAWLEKRVINP